MNINNPTVSRGVRRRRGLVLFGLALVITVIGLVAVHKSGNLLAKVSSTGVRGQLTIDDGKIQEGQQISVFDTETPAVGELNRELLETLQQAAADAQDDGVRFLVNSGWRSPAYQERLLQDAIAEYGSREAAARWVATPETSAHVSGDAVDLGPLTTSDWLAQHGSAYGLCQTYANEAWHYELRPEAVTEGCPQMFADPTQDPRMQQ